ncbi:MAG: DNA-processing protein DprA [Firmicutes bacterium]|nr:DNA-processing protein DprA [Bacillota bacterium]
MYTKEESIYVWLDLFDFLSTKKKAALLACFKSASDLWENLETNSGVKNALTAQEINTLVLSHTPEFLSMQMKGLQRLGITAVTIVSKDYPESLSNSFDPPYVLYCKGDVGLLKSKSIAIVGSRKCTRYGREQSELFAKTIAKHGIAITSGLSDGIDTAAHKGAMAAENGKTIAVLAGGLNSIYPATNQELSEQIANGGGLLVTEMRPSSKPQLYSFPRRNRIIAALSLGVFVPEMGGKSGAMYTVNYASEYGKELFVLPGPVNSFASMGSNRLLKECQAACVLTPADILARIGIDMQADEQKVARAQLSLDEQVIFEALKLEPLHYDEIKKITKLEPKTINSLLTTMEINGLIEKLPGNIYCLAN